MKEPYHIAALRLWCATAKHPRHRLAALINGRAALTQVVQHVAEAAALSIPHSFLRPRRGQIAIAVAGARRRPQILGRVMEVDNLLRIRKPVVEHPPDPLGAVADARVDVPRRAARRRQFAAVAA